MIHKAGTLEECNSATSIQPSPPGRSRQFGAEWRVLGWSLALSAALGFCGLLPAHAADLVTNGGFEEPGTGNGLEPIGWIKDFNSFGVYTGAARSGGWGLHPGADGNTGGEYQDLATTAGGNYAVSLWVQNFTAAPGTSHVDVLIGEPGDGTYSYLLPDDVNEWPETLAFAPGLMNHSFVVGTPASGGWQEVKFQFTAPGATTRLGIYNSYKTGDTVHSINVDDVSVLALSELGAITLSAGIQYANPGTDLPVTVTITEGANQTQPIAVSISSDNPAAVTLAGAVNNVLELNFGAGATNSQTFTAHINAADNANLSASASGLSPATLALGGLPARTLVERFRAASLAVSDGEPVGIWIGDVNPAVAAMPFSADLPVFRANATPAGSAAVGFTNNGMLFIPSDLSPMGGATNFSLALVFRSLASGTGAGLQWFAQTGIVDADLAGAHHTDWGLSLDSNGVLNFGVGAPDYTFPGGSYAVADAEWHVAVVSCEATSQELRIHVDDLPAAVSRGSISRAPREVSNIVLGGSQNAARYFVGDIAELAFYNGALTTAEAADLIHNLKTDYAILFASEANIAMSAPVQTASPGAEVVVALTIPPGKNNAQPVTVTLATDNPAVASFSGGASGTVTFPAGTTNVQAFTVQVLGLGSATITASSPGLKTGTLTVSGRAPVPSLNLADNGGFEQPGTGNGIAPTGWTKDFNSFGTFTGAAYRGSWGLHTGADANSGGQYCDVATTTGAKYVLSIWVQNFAAAAGTSHLDVLIGLPGDGSSSFTLPGDVNETAATAAFAAEVVDTSFVVGTETEGGWQQVSFEFTAPGAVTRLGLYNSYKEGDTVHSINVDELALMPIALGLQRGIGDRLFLFWPGEAAGYVLQSSPALPAGWSDVTTAVAVQDGMNVVLETIGAGARFYRLRHP